MKKNLIITGIALLFAIVMAALISSSGNPGIDFGRILNCTTTFYNVTDYNISNIERNYTCSDTIFNYTFSPKYAWCWHQELNSSYSIIFNHTFLRANLPTATIWWNDTIYIPYNVEKNRTNCIRTGQAWLLVNNSGVISNYTVDYSSWGECGMDKSNKQVVCDSKYDGNADGKCTSGESCINLSYDGGWNQIKHTFRELDNNQFNITWWKNG
jgi:hypothetical protein